MVALISLLVDIIYALVDPQGPVLGGFSVRYIHASSNLGRAHRLPGPPWAGKYGAEWWILVIGRGSSFVGVDYADGPPRPPFWPPSDPHDQDGRAPALARRATARIPLGTDNLQRDVLSRIILRGPDHSGGGHAWRPS